MKKTNGIVALTLLAVLFIMLLVAAILGPYANAAVATQNILAVTNPNIKNYTLVYIQIVSKDGVSVYDTTASSNTGAMVAMTGATYANTAITVTIDSNFYIGQLVMPSNLTSNFVIVRLMGSTDATADKDDTQIAAFGVQCHTSGGITKPETGLPVIF